MECKIKITALRRIRYIKPFNRRSGPVFKLLLRGPTSHSKDTQTRYSISVYWEPTAKLAGWKEDHRRRRPNDAYRQGDSFVCSRRLIGFRGRRWWWWWWCGLGKEHKACTLHTKTYRQQAIWRLGVITLHACLNMLMGCHLQCRTPFQYAFPN